MRRIIQAGFCAAILTIVASESIAQEGGGADLRDHVEQQEQAERAKAEARERAETQHREVLEAGAGTLIWNGLRWVLVYAAETFVEDEIDRYATGEGLAEDQTLDSPYAQDAQSRADTSALDGPFSPDIVENMAEKVKEQDQKNKGGEPNIAPVVDD